MPFEFVHESIPGVVLIKPRRFIDERGFFMETFRQTDFAAHGIETAFVQENHSRSSKHAIRGLHFQRAPKAQAKLIRVIRGAILDVAVDLRKESPTFGHWICAELSDENGNLLYLPEWCAHGFCVLSDTADVVYKASNEYSPQHESGVIWNESVLNIPWPTRTPILSERDRRWPPLNNIETGMFRTSAC